MKLKVILLIAAALVTVGASPDHDSSSSDSSEDVDPADDAAIPSFLGTFGSKIAMAENIYDEYEDDDSTVDEADDEEAPPKACCFPDVWQGQVYADFGYTPLGFGKSRRSGDDYDDSDDKKDKKRKRGENCGGRTIASRSLSMVYIDGTNKRLAGDMMENHGKPAEGDMTKWSNISYIFKIGANKTGDLYLFDRKAQKCRHRQMRNVEWTRQCIPATAAYGGQLSLGPGAGGLKVDTWMFKGSARRADAVIATSDESADNVTTPRPRPRPRPKMHLGAVALVLPGSCVPVVIQEEGSVYVGDEFEDDNGFRMKPKPKRKWRGETFVGSAFYANLQTTIKDPSVFTAPSYCKSNPNTMYYDEMEDELPSVLERFIVL